MNWLKQRTVWLFAAALLLGGCSTPEMKGTPFYTGEYEINVPGADERRVNLWPLAYYRAPALSVLWPVFEHTEEHVAVRPLFSAYGDTTNYSEYNLLWPLLRYHTAPDKTEWHATLVGDYRYSESDTRYTGYPWPLLFSWRDKQTHGLFTPLYAYEASDNPEVRDGWDALPLLLSWRRRQGESRDLTAALGVYHQRRAGDDRSGWLLPLYLYDARDRLLLTPLCGWDQPDVRDPDGYWYPFTPLAGVNTGARRGGWLFPFFSHTATPSNDTFRTQFLLLGHAEHTVRAWANRTTEDRQLALFPVFSHAVYASASQDPKSKIMTESVSRIDRQLLLRWSEETRTTRRSLSALAKPGDDYLMTSTDSGLFPLWDTETRAKTRLNGSPLSATRASSFLFPLYDAKRNTVEADGKTPALDYTRRRVLWRVWHYEKRNGDVSVDLFPFITHDAHADGFRKTSFFWRLYRYERASDGKVSRDLLYLPLVRTP
jgi:hypothetical protein